MKWYLFVPILLLSIASISSCQEKEPSLYGEWVFYYTHGDSMIYQLDTAQMIVRKFAVQRIQDTDGQYRDSVISFEQVYFYNNSNDTLYLQLTAPTDTGVNLVPSSYHTIELLTTDSLILAPEMGPDIPFTRYSDKWPEESKQQMLDKYHNWLERKINREDK